MDLDPATFSDEVFISYASVKPHEEDGQNSNFGSRKQKDAEMNTDDQLFADAETNTRSKKTGVSIQTDKVMASTGVGDDANDEDEQYYDEEEKAQRQAQRQLSAAPSYDENALAKWLQSIYPKLSQVLDSNFNARTFDNYEVFWEEERGEIEMWQKMQTNYDFKEANKAVQKAINQVKQAANEGGNEFEDDWETGNQVAGQSKGTQSSQSDHYQVVSVAWSCNGSTLAVAYGKTNHVTWCEHQSAVSTWGIFRREFDAKKPNRTLDVSNCLTTIEFHPNDPLILAGGTINGEIYLWNIDSEESQISSSAIDEYYHREAITKLIWVKYESLTSLAVSYSLMSVSTDAKILVWRLQDKLRYPAKGHLLARKKDGEMGTVGGTSFAKIGYGTGAGGQEDSTFIVGTEGGSIFKCNIQQPVDKDISHYFDQNTGCRWKQEAISLLSNLPNKVILEVKKKVERYVQDKGEKDVWAPTVYHAKPDIKMLFSVPFNSNYERHLGPVTAISASPFVKRLFLTSSTDGQLRLYDTLSNRPVAMFEPGGYGACEYLLSVEFSPFRPAVFAAVGNSGNVYIYDLVQSKSAPSYILKNQDEGVSHSLRVSQSVCFNPRQRDFLAVGYHDGFARIYRLNYQLANIQKNELKVLQSFLEEKGSE
eukprot:403363522